MRCLPGLFLAVLLSSCSLTDEGVENTPANIEILFPKSGVTYYQGNLPDYVVFRISDQERNIQRILISSNGYQEYAASNFVFDLYDEIPDTIFGVTSILADYVVSETTITVDAEETDEDGLVFSSAETRFNLIPDSVFISNPVISNIEMLSEWDDMANADIDFDIHTESGDLSTILAIRFTRFPNLFAYQPGQYISAYYSGQSPALTSDHFSTRVQMSKTDSELYALIYVKSVILGNEIKFYVMPIGTF